MLLFFFFFLIACYVKSGTVDDEFAHVRLRVWIQVPGRLGGVDMFLPWLRGFFSGSYKWRDPFLLHPFLFPSSKQPSIHPPKNNSVVIDLFFFFHSQWNDQHDRQIFRSGQKDGAPEVTWKKILKNGRVSSHFTLKLAWNAKTSNLFSISSVKISERCPKRTVVSQTAARAGWSRQPHELKDRNDNVSSPNAEPGQVEMISAKSAWVM